MSTPLSPAVLAERLRQLPPGAALPVLPVAGGFAEPGPGEPASHALRPEPADRPHGAANAWFCTRLAAACGLAVPAVTLLHLPEPALLLSAPTGERLDGAHLSAALASLRTAPTPTAPTPGASMPRTPAPAATIPIASMSTASMPAAREEATVAALARLAAACRTPAATRQQLYRWLVFSVLTGGGEGGLDQPGVLAGPGGFHLAPFDALLCTTVYAEATARDALALPWPLAEARRFGEVRPRHLIAAGASLGIPEAPATRLFSHLLGQLLPAARRLFEQLPRADLAHGEVRLLWEMVFGVMTDMDEQLRA